MGAMYGSVNHLERPCHHVVLGMVVKPEVAAEGGSLTVDAIGIRHGMQGNRALLGTFASELATPPVRRLPIVRHAWLED
eukprot:7776626-Alexandrium_andersonii.AAC.1